MDGSPAVNVKCELLSVVGGRRVSPWSWTALLHSLAPGARQVKHNKLRLSQTWGIIYLDRALRVWLQFSSALHFPVLVVLQPPNMSLPITPALLVCTFLVESEKRSIQMSLFVPFSIPAPSVPKHNLLCSIFKKEMAERAGRGAVKSQVLLSQTFWHRCLPSFDENLCFSAETKQANCILPPCPPALCYYSPAKAASNCALSLLQIGHNSLLSANLSHYNSRR